MNKHIEQEEPSLIPESARTDSRVLILGYQNYKPIGKNNSWIINNWIINWTNWLSDKPFHRRHARQKYFGVTCTANYVIWPVYDWSNLSRPEDEGPGCCCAFCSGQLTRQQQNISPNKHKNIWRVCSSGQPNWWNSRKRIWQCNDKILSSTALK